MLSADAAAKHATELWHKHAKEIPGLDRIYDYSRGKRGKPSLPSDPDDELRELADICVVNVMPLVVDTFVQYLNVSGFRSPSAPADEAAWTIWQRERMDARQSEVHRPAVTYGASYLVERLVNGKTQFLPRSPRRIFAAYVDPTRDEWPQEALETWWDFSGSQKVRRGRLYDAEATYDVEFGGEGPRARVTKVTDGVAHGFDVCPVVRFVNDRDAEDLLHGEVEPLITDQRAINAVNFDRLIVSRFGAFPQKYIAGWADTDEAGLRQLSSMRVLAFEDPDVKPGAFPSATVTPYNEILADMIAHVAVKARVPVFALTGDISNVGAETVALVDAPNQRKTAAKRLSFGESWEQALRLAAKAEGVNVPDDAEVLWVDTEARSFAQVVDGVVKLNAAGVPIDALLDQIPGLSQQKTDEITASLDRAQATSLATGLLAAARPAAA